LPPKIKYDVEVKYRLSIRNNVKHWKVFEDDLEIKGFLEIVEDLSSLHIDQDQDTEENPHTNFFLIKLFSIILFSYPVIIFQKDLSP
jgi:hypothetical protein